MRWTRWSGHLGRRPLARDPDALRVWLLAEQEARAEVAGTSHVRGLGQPSAAPTEDAAPVTRGIGGRGPGPAWRVAELMSTDERTVRRYRATDWQPEAYLPLYEGWGEFTDGGERAWSDDEKRDYHQRVIRTLLRPPASSGTVLHELHRAGRLRTPGVDVDAMTSTDAGAYLGVDPSTVRKARKAP